MNVAQQKATRIPPLVDIMVSGEERKGVGGVLVNDANGLCLVSKGEMSPTSGGSNDSGFSSGVYTSLTKLASTLTPYQTSRVNNENPSSPLITIEMDGPSSILIKEYDGHALAMKVPNR